jgi:hypothetical protein
MAAVKLKSIIIPEAPRKRYRFLIEWTASADTENLQVDVIWFDKDKSSILTQSLLDAPVSVAHEWQTDNFSAIPPSNARWARVVIGKGNNAVKFAIARQEFKEFDTNIAQSLSQIFLKDDFCSTTIGELPWIHYNIQGFLTPSKVTASGILGNWSEFGITRLTTEAFADTGGVIHLERMGDGPPPVGTEFRAKVRMETTNNYLAWFGLWQKINMTPDTALANSNSGIGFRAEAAGSTVNWFGVVRDGTSEATVDMGVVANGTWRTLGWIRTTTGIQFTNKALAVGAEVTSVVPDSADVLVPMYGIVTSTGAEKEMDIDFFCLQAFLNR